MTKNMVNFVCFPQEIMTTSVFLQLNGRDTQMMCRKVTFVTSII